MNAVNKITALQCPIISLCTRLMSTCPNERLSSISKPLPLLYRQLPGTKLESLITPINVKCSRTSKEKLCPSILDRFLFNYELPVIPNHPLPEKEVIGDIPIDKINSGIKASKQDLFWRRRRMLRHKLTRWRQLNKRLYARALANREKKRQKKHAEELRWEWKKLGLSQAPPPLTESEKRELVKKWQEQNLWNETMTGAELKEFTRVKKVRQQTDKK